VLKCQLTEDCFNRLNNAQLTSTPRLINDLSSLNPTFYHGLDVKKLADRKFERIVTARVRCPIYVFALYATHFVVSFSRATAATAEARLSHRNSVCLSVTRVDQSKTVQARITRSSSSAA